MDMVCVKDEGVEHNFDTDPLNVVVDGDWIKAVGTTLGADNGIAIALILDLFTDKEAVHGPLEAIITVSEETGLEGAFGLDPTLVDSRLMVNLDSDTEGVIYIGCAGGVETRAIFNLTKESLKDGFNGFELIVDGLLGGHSGAEIHKQRANAITLNARILDAISIVSTTYLQSIEGGTKRNVIPSYCKSTIAIASNNLKEAAEAVEKLTKELKKEYADSDPALNVSFKLVKLTNRKVISLQQSSTIIKSLFTSLHGVERMSETIEGVVETSTNLASVKTGDKQIEVVASHRSSLSSMRDMVARRWCANFELAGSKTISENGYPAWTPNLDSHLAQLAKEIWEKEMDSSVEITAIHAGLECGIINSLIEGMDSISIGPNMKDIHSTLERLSISSSERLSHFIRKFCVAL